jgi:hypothetical protein
MRVCVLSVLVFLMLLGLVPRAFAQGTRTTETTIHVFADWTCDYLVGNCECADGFVAVIASAAAANLASGEVSSMCSSVSPDPTDAELNGDSGDPCEGVQRAIASAMSGSAASSSEVEAVDVTSTHSSESFMSFGRQRSYFVVGEECRHCEDKVWFDPAPTATTVGSRVLEWVSCDSQAISIEEPLALSLTWQVSNAMTSQCAFQDTTFPEDSEILMGVVYVSRVVTITPASGSPVQVVRQGLLAVGSQGSLVRHGLFADSEFDPAWSGGDAFEIAGTVSPTANLGTFTGSVTISESSRSETFSDFGDMDRDGVLCRSDLLVLASFGTTSIGDGVYDARGDIDLDGDTDATDAGLIWDSMPCPVDFNCDGNADQDDIAALQDAIASADPFTDVNHDGNSDQDDVYDLTQWIASGCP